MEESDAHPHVALYEVTMADLTTILIGASGAIIGASIQLWRMIKEDGHASKLHERANHFTNGLLTRIASLEQENTTAHTEKATLYKKVGLLEGELSAVKSQLNTIRHMFEELTEKYQNTIKENEFIRAQLNERNG